MCAIETSICGIYVPFIKSVRTQILKEGCLKTFTTHTLILEYRKSVLQRDFHTDLPMFLLNLKMQVLALFFPHLTFLIVLSGTEFQRP